MIELLVLKGVLCLLAGLCNAGMDTLAHHYGKSIFRFWDFQYWGPTSWENKNHRPWYIPAALTDGWHLFKWFMLAFLFAGVALPSGFLAWYWNSVFCWSAFFVGFWVGYNHLFLRK